MGLTTELNEIGGCGCFNKAHEVKLLLETAKLNDITVNDELFKKIFDTVYENDSKSVPSGTTCGTPVLASTLCATGMKINACTFDTKKLA